MRKIMALVLALCVSCMIAGCSKQCEHQMTASVTKQASCQSTGITTYTCTNCGFQFTAEIPALEHEFAASVTQEATCAEKGVLTYTCSLCGTAKTEEIPEAEHVFDFYSLDPSYCTVCGQTVEGAGVDANSPWNGKKWVALGTSLTSEEQGKYVEPLAERSGLEVVNYGVSGATACGDVLYNAQNAEDLADADLVTVEFGVNDWFESIPLGSVGDAEPYLFSSEDWDNGGSEEGTFAGACYQIFKSIQENAPDAVVVFITEPTGQYDSASGDNCERQQENYLGLWQQDYTDVAIEVARCMGVRVIDAGSTCSINQEHSYYLEDHIHHTEAGGKQYALTIWMELRNVAPLL